MSDDVLRQVEKWVEHHGAPLELLTARAFGQAGFTISQGFYYRDVVTGKMRECDLLAFHHQTAVEKDKQSFTVATTFLIECKRSARHPWLVFMGADQELFQNIPTSAYGWIMDDLAKQSIADSIAMKWGEFTNIFDSSVTAYSIFQTRLGDKDEASGEVNRAYEAVEQLLSAVEGRMALIAAAKNTHYCHLLFPVLILDGKLFECSLVGDDTVTQEITETSLVLRDRLVGGGSARVKVVTKQQLPSFAERCKSMADWLCKLAPVGQRRLEERRQHRSAQIAKLSQGRRSRLLPPSPRDLKY